MELDGYAVAHGLGYLQDLPLERFFNFVWYMLTRNAEKKDVERLRGQLWQQERGTVVEDPRSPWSSANELDALRSLKRQMGGTATAAPAPEKSETPATSAADFGDSTRPVPQNQPGL